VEFGVTRTTIRQALDVLKQRQLLQSRWGVGTRFVRAPETPKLVASSGDPLHAGLGTKTRVLTSDRVNAPADAATFFGIESGSKICRIVRIHELNKEPLSVVISYLPLEYAPALTRRGI
jgi:DNA-binding GntR family transcriptional regulator